jgi:hypothetical protein
VLGDLSCSKVTQPIYRSVGLPCDETPH